MSASPTPLSGPDFTVGVELKQVPEGGTLLGHVGEDAVLLARRGAEVFAVGATCTHYGAPLAEGLLVGDQLHCPWHHACFDVRSGEAVGPPALNPLACWKVEQRGARLLVQERLPPRAKPSPAAAPSSVLIIGAGGAGNAAAEMLRREGYSGRVTMVGAEQTVPVDRPNLSKDYLAGTAQEDWVPLRGRDFYAEQKIELVLGVRAVSIDLKNKRVGLSDQSSHDYGALLLATGADPIPLAVPGAEKPHVHRLRSLADSKGIIERAKSAKRAVVVGASFIALEAAAALRTRGLEVHLVAPDERPLERVMGPQLGDFIRALHEEHGVVFHLKHTVKSIGDHEVTLDDGSQLPCELVVIGIGVKPALALAEQAGLRTDKGVTVDEFLQTSAPSVYAAGDIARWPDARAGKPIRIEHWVIAERQGQTAARNILGQKVPFTAVPFFWSQHYDVPVAYVGYAEGWDKVEVAGSLAERNCLLAYRVAGKIAAIATIYRDPDSLQAEVLFERNDQAGLEALVARARQ